MSGNTVHREAASNLCFPVSEKHAGRVVRLASIILKCKTLTQKILRSGVIDIRIIYEAGGVTRQCTADLSPAAACSPGGSQRGWCRACAPPGGGAQRCSRPPTPPAHQQPPASQASPGSWTPAESNSASQAGVYHSKPGTNALTHRNNSKLR